MSKEDNSGDFEFATSESTTCGVPVSVQAHYDSTRSRPNRGLWFFLYTVTITNGEEECVQLLTRHWVIRDAQDNLEEVRGDGVVGETPTLAVGESHQYTSGCPLTTEFGSMRGSYGMVTASGEHFNAEIAEFVLSPPYTVH